MEKSPSINQQEEINLEGEFTSTERQDYSWVKYALLTAVCIGFTNFLLGDLSARLGVAGSFPIFYGIVTMGLLYHIFVKESTAIYWI